MMRINSKLKCKIKIIKAGTLLSLIKTTRPLKVRKNLRMKIKKLLNRNNVKQAKTRNITINLRKR